MIISIRPYGDQAILVNFEQRIDPLINKQVIALKGTLERANIRGVNYMIPAYCSLTIVFLPEIIDYQILKKVVEQLAIEIKLVETEATSRHLRIPVCYEQPYALDLLDLCEQKGMTAAEIIELHLSQPYRVYMLGFLPGFVFMGKIPSELECSRKETPRLKIPAGAVGLAGFQTGIYPSISPGGWQIIGQTPIELFNPNLEQPFFFRVGDEVQFYQISSDEFVAYAED